MEMDFKKKKKQSRPWQMEDRDAKMETVAPAKNRPE